MITEKDGRKARNGYQAFIDSADGTEGWQKSFVYKIKCKTSE
jgi:hypothetical protein